MKNKKNIQRTEIIIFIILLFFQNLAVITTSSFGIAGITVFLLYIFLKYKLFLKIDKKFILLVGGAFGFIALSQVLNHAINISQIIRHAMIFFIAWTTIKYIKLIFNNDQKDFFEKAFFFAMMVITIYGIYQIIACKLEMPNFFNALSNNPSYGARGFFESYTGWMNDVRIYTTFYEPSSYALFLTIAYFYTINFKNLNNDKKFVLTVLTIFNLIFTFSRSGWVSFAYFIVIYAMFRILEDNTNLKKLMKIAVVFLPFITLAIMSTLGIVVFKDLSSTGRTFSSLYYLVNSIKGLKGLLFGHGLGSMMNIPEDLTYHGYAVENFAHNGYIDIMYQLGIPFFAIILYAIIRYLKEKKINDEWIVYATVFTICCSGSLYNVESIIALVCVVIANSVYINNLKFREMKQKKEKREEEELEKEIGLGINNNEVIVSICCMAHNQEEYIRDALSSFVKQKTNFKYEIIIHDDASTDNTPNIIKEFEIKYPDIVKVIYEKENQYEKGRWSLVKTCKKARGKYIAICGGDDFWTDERKLQRQVNYMETHPKCTLCFHDATIWDMNTDITENFVPRNRNVAKYLKEDNIYNVGELELLDSVPTASLMFRTDMLKKLPDWFEKSFTQDWALKLVMASFGYAYYMDKPMSVYRINSAGQSTSEESIDIKMYLLERKKETADWMDEFTEGQYKKIFNRRKAECEVEELLLKGKNTEILKSGYLEYLDTMSRIKYLIRMYCSGIIRMCKKIKNTKIKTVKIK